MNGFVVRTPELKHTFVAGVGGHLVIYCQHPAEPGTGPVPGFTVPTCGYLEEAHTLTAEQETANDDELVQQLISEIGGWPR